jgi:hypothetical protein
MDFMESFHVSSGSTMFSRLPSPRTACSSLDLRDPRAQHPRSQKSLTRFLDEQSSRLIFISADDDALPDGPYFLKGHNVHRAWRLYADENLAFTSLSYHLMIVANIGKRLRKKHLGRLLTKHSFESLKAGAYFGLYPVVAVPSRLYSPPTSERPLNGLRITVKDNYHLSGFHSTLGSRSYTKLYPPQQETSVIVKALIDQGVVIVGKTKLGAYAGSEVPPEKCIDYFPPWNPRGDGYQGPSGSSSGAGSSVASYPWVDLALGTDSKYHESFILAFETVLNSP